MNSQTFEDTWNDWFICIDPGLFEDSVVRVILSGGLVSCWLGLTGSCFILNHFALRGKDVHMSRLMALLSFGDALACLLHFTIHLFILIDTSTTTAMACVWLRELYTASIRATFVFTLLISLYISYLVVFGNDSHASQRSSLQQRTLIAPCRTQTVSLTMLTLGFVVGIGFAFVPAIVADLLGAFNAVKLDDEGWCELRYPWNFISWTIPAMLTFALMVPIYIFVSVYIMRSRWSMSRAGCWISMPQRIALILLAFLLSWFPEVLVGTLDFSFRCSIPWLTGFSIFCQTLQGFFNAFVYVISTRQLKLRRTGVVVAELLFAPLLFVPVQLIAGALTLRRMVRFLRVVLFEGRSDDSLDLVDSMRSGSLPPLRMDLKQPQEGMVFDDSEFETAEPVVDLDLDDLDDADGGSLIYRKSRQQRQAQRLLRWEAAVQPNQVPAAYSVDPPSESFPVDSSDSSDDERPIPAGMARTTFPSSSISSSASSSVAFSYHEDARFERTLI